MAANKLGLSLDDLIDLYNQATRDSDKTSAALSIAPLVTTGQHLAGYPADMSPEVAVVLRFVMDAIRLNNVRIEEQLAAIGLDLQTIA